MRPFKRLGLLAIACITSLIVLCLFHSPAHSQARIQLQSTPALDQVVPATEPVRLTVLLRDRGLPLADATVQIKLFTPAKTPWLTSDFPIVEGTQLLELTDVAQNGELTIAPVLPIRGQYRLDVSVTPATATSSPFAESLTFSVPENPVKYRNAAILVGILLLAGLGSGWILGGDQTVREGEVAPRPVQMLLSVGILVAIVVLLIINVSAEFANAHGEAHHETALPATSVEQSQDIRAELSGDTAATVGRLATQTVTIANAAGDPVSEAQLTIQAIALEHHQPVFTYETTPDAQGTFSWKEQFFDGAPHQIIVDVTPLTGSNRIFEPFQVAHEVDVQGIAPPLLVRVIGLLYFTSIYVVGLAIGFWLHRRVSSSKRPVG